MKMHATLTGCGKDPEKGKQWGGHDLPTRWELTLTNDRGEVTLPYWTGSLVPSASTTPAAVLGCWLRDIADTDQPLADYLADFGFDPEVIAAIRGYEDGRRAAATLAELLGTTPDALAERVTDTYNDPDTDDPDEALAELAASMIER